MRKQQHNVQASTTAGFWLYWCEKIHLHIMAHQWPYTHTHIHKPHVGTSASVCIEKHLRTKPPEVSTFLDGKQAWKLLSHAGQASGITSAHNMNPVAPPPHTHTHGAVKISNIFPFPLQGRRERSRSSGGPSPSLVIISFTLHSAREMNHGGWNHCVWGREGGPDVKASRYVPWMFVCVLCVWILGGRERPMILFRYHQNNRGAELFSLMKMRLPPS